MSTYSKNGTVNSPDAKFTGHEPDWHNWESFSLDKFYSNRSRSLRFYGYYLSDSELKDITLKWMKSEKYSLKDITAIKNSDSGVLPSTVGKIIRCLDRGMPHIHPRAQEYYDALPFHETPPIAKSDYAVVKDEIKKTLSACQALVLDDEQVEKKVKVMSPIDRIRENVRKDIIMPLENLLDQWTSIENGVATYNLNAQLKDHKVPTNGCKQITDWLEKHRIEYSDALEKLCPQAMEGFSYLAKTDLRKIVKEFDVMLRDVHLYSKAKISERKPRIKKVKSSIAQVAKLQYQLNSSEYSLDSIAPTRIPGSYKLYVFNSKTRGLTVYIAKGSAGFGVKGSGLLDWDIESSYTIGLRKPADIIAKLLSASPKKVDNVLDEIKAVKKKANGRFNEHCILLKILEHKL